MDASWRPLSWWNLEEAEGPGGRARDIESGGIAEWGHLEALAGAF